MIVGKKKNPHFVRAFLFSSGRADLNRRPLAPEASALTGLRYAPIISLYYKFNYYKTKYQQNY